MNAFLTEGIKVLEISLLGKVPICLLYALRCLGNLRVRVRLLGRLRADAVHEVLEMLARRVRPAAAGAVVRVREDRLAGRVPLLDGLALLVEDLHAAARPEERRAVRAVHHRARGDVHVGLLVDAAQALPRDELAVREVPRGVLRVGPFPVRVRRHPVLAARRGHAARPVRAEAPARHVHEVHRVVAALARAPVAEPVPVVVDHVVAKRLARRGPLPDVPVEPLGNGDRLTLPDGVAARHVPGLAPDRFADERAAPHFRRRHAERN